MDKRELGIQIITHAQAGFVNISQMITACAALALKYGDLPYKDNKKAIEAQIRKYDADLHILKKTEDPREIDLRNIGWVLAELFGDAGTGTPGEIIGNIVSDLVEMLGFYKQISIYGSQFAVGASVEEVLETKINDLVRQYDVTVIEINRCVKVAPLLMEIANIKEFEKNTRLDELEACRDKLFS